MTNKLTELPLPERIQLVEVLWDSIADEQHALPLTREQQEELDRRLERFSIDGKLGLPADEVIHKIRQRL